MGSHADRDHREGQYQSVLESLRAKAEVMTDLGVNRVTNDRVLEEWEHDGVRIQMLPDDPHGVLRISIGGHSDIKPSDYCNFRGDQGRCIVLLEKCLVAIKAKTP